MAIKVQPGKSGDGAHRGRPSEHRGDVAGDASLLNSTIAAYRQRIGRDRRAGFVGVAAILVAVAWVLTAFCLLLNVAAYMPAVAAALTIALPLLAVLLELAIRPSLAQTARILDARMDNQQRLVTALELGKRGDSGPLDSTQVRTSARYLAAFDPRALYPVRTARPMLTVAVGLLCFAIAIIVLKDAGSFVPFQVQALPATTQDVAAVPSATAAGGLPGSNLTPSPTIEVRAAGRPSPSASPQGDGQSGSGQNGQGDAASRAADSKSAQSGLDKLGQALDGQSAAQQAADNLRKGNYGQAAKDISDLGTQSDQLSAAAKKDLAGALEQAANDPSTGSDLRSSEQAAADALRNGEYKKVASSLDGLGKSVQDTAGKVMSQQEMAKAYPSPAAPSPSSQNGQQPQNGDGGQQNNSGKQGGQGSQPGQSQSGQQNGQQAGSQQNDSGGQGQGQQGSQSGGAGEGQQSGQQGQGQGQQGGGQQGGGQDQGQTGSPGTGHRESGPTGPGGITGGGQNPFDLQGSQPQQANRPGTGDRPALSLDGSGSAGGTVPVAPGSASNVPGENSTVPVARWDVIQRYFNGK